MHLLISRRRVSEVNQAFAFCLIIEQFEVIAPKLSIFPCSVLIGGAGFDSRVLIYNGQLDVIIAWPLTESFIRSMQWPGAEEYLKAQRQLW